MSMIQRPNAVGLILCRLVIVEHKSYNVTLANSFVRMGVGLFPSAPAPFSVYAILTDGLGDMTLDLTITRGDTMDVIYSRSLNVTFNNPLRQIRLWWDVRSCSFPVPRRYQISIEANKELITQGALEAFQTGGSDE